MATLHISLPAALKQRVDAEVAAGRYATADDYVGSLIRNDSDEEVAVLAALEAGEASGLSELTPEAILEELLRARLAA